ncbi:MAG: ShlB/FhaC/HecB family hemolysin secretion/activation protein [Vulcanimicrobiota bacterium]
MLLALALVSLPVCAQSLDARPEPSAETRRVDRFVVEGNTLLPKEKLDELLRIYEGKNLTLQQMKDAAADLTSLYQRNGFYLVRAIVPQQDFNSGQIRLTVVEGKIGEIKVQGAEYYDPDFIRDRFQVAVDDRQFRADDFTRAMALLNELSDLEVKAVLSPGKDPGTADVTLQVKDGLPLHASLDYNNYGTPQTGQNRAGLDIEAGNLAFQGDMLTVRGVYGFPSRQNTFVQAQYLTPVNLDGTTVGFSYANGAFAVSQGLGAILDVRGNADVFTLSAAHPLERDLDFASNLGVAVAHKNIVNNFFGGALPFSHDEYTMGKLTYSADWRGPDGRTLLQASWAQGLGGTPAGDPLISRVGANGHFSRFNLDMARVQRIQEGLYLVVRGSGQYATTPLYVGEQFALGGPDTVRGYNQAELLGDNAYLLGAELRWSPFLEDPDIFQVVAFLDHGGVGLRQLQPGDFASGNHLTGAGFGIRWALAPKTNLRFDVGFPLTARPGRDVGDPAIYAGLQTKF